MKINIEIDVDFSPYDTKRKNERAETSIRAWVLEVVRDSCSYIPMYIERDCNGSMIEDCTKKSRIKIV